MRIERFISNPVLTPEDIRPSTPLMQIECLLNPGVFRFRGKTWLLIRVAERPEQKVGAISFPILDHNNDIKVFHIPSDSPELDASDPRVINYKGCDYLTTMSHLRLVCSEDGIHFHEDQRYTGLVPSDQHESYGIEDCRVCQIDNRYYLTYTAVSPDGVAVRMRETEDWIHFEDYGIILPPHNKDCALFTEKINDRYMLLHRPSSPEIGGNYIWLAESTDLIHWGRHSCVAKTRPGMWDSARIGAGCSPIRTEKGWLEIYHGADENNRYCLGAMLLDLKNPSKVLARSIAPLMVPSEPYEMAGFFGNVIFTNGHIVDGDDITMYYGASDSVICAARLSVEDILSSL